MKRSHLHITDHAVLRYLERVEGRDIEQLRRQIARKASLALDHEGACGVICEGFKYRISGKTIVTVVRASRPDIRTKRGRK